MTEPTKPITGRCLCGGVTYSTDADPVAQAACHCEDCQRQSGGPFSVIVGVPLAALDVKGETLTAFNTRGVVHGEPTERHFCNRCGAGIYSISGALPEVAFVKVGSLDDASWVAPAMEVFAGSAQPWSPRFEGIASFERTPGG